jgi:UPF0755 protein
VTPPTREDAKKIVAKKKAQLARVRIVKVSPRGRPPKGKKKRVVRMIQIPLTLFITSVAVLALVIGLLIAWQVTGYRFPVRVAKEEKVVSPDTESVIIYGGYTLEEIDTLLANKKLIKRGEFLKAAEKVTVERGLPFSEGWFLSGSHPFEGSAVQFAVQLQDSLNSAVRPYLINLEKLGVTLSDVVVIASMVQRETNNPDQMPLIAQVIYNRLKEGMPLGIDATTRYGLKAWDRLLTTEDFNPDHPYDTRRRRGLPPTGIGAPTPEALYGAFNPIHHDYFYYLHDKSGALHMGRTYDEHKENIAKFLN